MCVECDPRAVKRRARMRREAEVLGKIERSRVFPLAVVVGFFGTVGAVGWVAEVLAGWL